MNDKPSALKKFSELNSILNDSPTSRVIGTKIGMTNYNKLKANVEELGNSIINKNPHIIFQLIEKYLINTLLINEPYYAKIDHLDYVTQIPKVDNLYSKWEDLNHSKYKQKQLILNRKDFKVK